MADTKYLQKRGSCWYIRVPKPPKAWKSSSEFICSLRTPELKTAQRLRDKYLMPILAETAAREMVATMARCLGAADESIARQLAELRAELSGHESSLTLREAGDRFLRYLKSSQAYAPASLRKYATSVDGACHVLGEDADPERLAKADTVRLRDALLALPIAWQLRNGSSPAPRATQRHLSGKSVNGYLRDLRRMFQWLIDEGHVKRTDNPFSGVSVARVATNHKRAPTAPEAEALMNLPRPKAVNAEAWRMMPLLARYTGCRAGELSQLRAEDIVVERGVRCIRITSRGEGKRLKTSSSERIVPVADKLVPHLDALVGKRKAGRLLDAGDWKGKDGMIKHAHEFLKHFNQRAKRVAPGLCFHCWRVYANDAMATAGVDILDRERLLGHKSERTQAAYTPENLRRLKTAVNAIP